MSAFKELDPNVIRKLLEGQTDILQPLVSRELEFFKACLCPQCNSGSLESFIDSKNPFTSGQALPNKLLRCKECNTEFDPYTKLITRVTDE